MFQNKPNTCETVSPWTPEYIRSLLPGSVVGGRVCPYALLRNFVHPPTHHCTNFRQLLYFLATPLPMSQGTIEPSPIFWRIKRSALGPRRFLQMSACAVFADVSLRCFSSSLVTHLCVFRCLFILFFYVWLALRWGFRTRRATAFLRGRFLRGWLITLDKTIYCCFYHSYTYTTLRYNNCTAAHYNLKC